MPDPRPLSAEELAQMERIIAEPITHGHRYFNDRTVASFIATIRERDGTIAMLEDKLLEREVE